MTDEHDLPDEGDDEQGDGEHGSPPEDVSVPVVRPRRGRRLGVLGVLGLVVVALMVIPGARDKLPTGVPVVGRDAGTVYDQLVRAGLPITHGEPSSREFRDMVRTNGCKSSRPFVRTDTEDTGWGFICVKPPAKAYNRISDAFDDIPMLIGPMYVDDGDGEVIVFGFGWPADASKTIYDAIGASRGTYLIEQSADSPDELGP
jgi:hypothetical protein